MVTWHKIAFELGMLATALIFLVCVTSLTRQGYHVIKNGRRFSLRDLLIVVTLVAAAVGLLVGMSRERDEGISRKSMSQLFDEYQTSKQGH